MELQRKDFTPPWDFVQEPKSDCPKAMRPEILSRIHSSHQGVASCLRKARDIVFWPGMSTEIKVLVERCSVYAKSQAKNARQPMQSHQIPDRPWSKIATDLFTLNTKNYITVVDYFSGFIEVSELQDTTSTSVIQALKEHFSRHGIPVQQPRVSRVCTLLGIQSCHIFILPPKE